MNANNHRRVVILGSGPAGLTAAVYTARANLNPLIIHGPLPGGQLTTTTEVENYPGFPEGIMGPDLMQNMEKQAVRFGAEISVATITSVELNGSPFTLHAGNQSWTTDSLIIATGASPRYLGIPGEMELLGYGVSTCATCDGAFFRGKRIMVVGGGDSACEEANFLTRFGERVFLVHRREELRASKIMQERTLKNPKIEPLWNSGLEAVNGSKEGGVQSVTLKNFKSGESKPFPVDAVFIAIGHTPNSSLFKGKLPMDENGYLTPSPNSTRLPIDGVFACGDVQDHVFRQAITAAGTGCMAAIEAERWLESRGV